jgi:hypothetical protein
VGGDIFHVLDMDVAAFTPPEMHPNGSGDGNNAVPVVQSIFPVPLREVLSRSSGSTIGNYHGVGNFAADGGANSNGTRAPPLAVIDNHRGVIIVHPDVLISPTKVAEGISCVRRGVISERVKSFGGTSLPAVLGNLRHSFIEVNVV